MRRAIILMLSFVGLGSLATAAWAEENRWEGAIAAFEAQDKATPPPKGAYVFAGSSSIRLWDLKQSFPELQTINRGFGGSEFSDLLAFADRIITPHQPRAVVIYSGDNDIARGKSAERVAADFRKLVEQIRNELPDAKIYLIAIKPSLARWDMVDQMRAANQLMRTYAEEQKGVTYVDVDGPMLGEDGRPRSELFLRDGLHLNEQGYALWASLLKTKMTD